MPGAMPRWVALKLPPPPMVAATWVAWLDWLDESMTVARPPKSWCVGRTRPPSYTNTVTPLPSRL
jgi:hypothetical protein